MHAIYRAPSVLVDAAAPAIAHRLAGLLTELGCEIAIQPSSETKPASQPLFDVAAHVEDLSCYASAVMALGRFLGMGDDDAAALLATPPSTVLGKVSRATVEALAARLGPGVTLIASDPDTATYDVFLDRRDVTARSRIVWDLEQRGYRLHAREGCILTGLARTEAEELWGAHHRSPALRIINRDFLRFDLVMIGGEPTPAAFAALEDVAGVPAAIVPCLFGEAPITVMEAVPSARVGHALDEFARAGVQARADLITFLRFGVEVTKIRERAELERSLDRLGVTAADAELRQLPWRYPHHLSHLQARLVRDALAAAGAETLLVEASEEDG